MLFLYYCDINTIATTVPTVFITRKPFVISWLRIIKIWLIYITIDMKCWCGIHILTMAKIEIQKEDLQFFRLIWEATFSNPFGQRREDIFESLGGSPSYKGHLDPKIQADLDRLITHYQALGGQKVSDFQTKDQALAKHIFLWQIYHQYADLFDLFIEDQDNIPSAGEHVVFAKSILDKMSLVGLAKAESTFYLALFYQLRRGWYFIVRGLVGCSKPMRKLRMDLWNTLFTSDMFQYETLLFDRMEDFSTMLLGPTGAGKGACARAIGKSGFIPFDVKAGKFKASFNDTFVSVNLSEYPETLLESELFGHAKGSFTGAITGHDGVLSTCSRHGSIFLDEIGDVSGAVQLKLLKVLDERLFSQVGSHATKRFDGRVIAATNQSLDQLRLDGKFRDDFYYRLCSDVIEVPSLHERFAECREELEMLVKHCVEGIVGQSSCAVVDQVLEVIDQKLGATYLWPGNVRELAQCVRSVLVKKSYSGDKQLPLSDLETVMATGEMTAQALTKRYCEILYHHMGSYADVANKIDLDWRTVKKYLSDD